MAKKAAAKPKLTKLPKSPGPSKGALAVVDKPARVGTPNRAVTPKVINQGHVPGSASRAVVPYKAPPSKLAAAGRVLGKVAKVAGPIGVAISMVTDATPAGAGSDKPKGPLMKGNRVYGGARPGNDSKSLPAAKKAPGLSRNPYDTARATTPAAPAKKAAVAPPKPTARPSFSKGSSSPPAYKPEAAQKRGNVTSGFHGNWQGAAPSDMQKRGGSKINRGGGLLGKVRGK